MRSISDVYNWNLFKPKVRKVIDINSDSLLRFEGTYQMNPEYVLQITRKDQKLHVLQNWDKSEYFLYPESGLLFFTLEDNAELIFEETANQKISKFTVMGTYVFEKSTD